MNEEERAQFLSILKQEGLYDESQGSLYCLIPRPEGVLLEKDFLHLWADRKEAEAFARKIPQRSPGIWRVFEEDIIPVYQFLDLDRLGLPERPKVLDIKPELYIDSFGKDNLRLFVILDDDTTEEEWAGPNLRDRRCDRGVATRRFEGGGSRASAEHLVQDKICARRASEARPGVMSSTEILPQATSAQAHHLATKESKRPQQVSLRRAVSTAYYAAFSFSHRRILSHLDRIWTAQCHDPNDSGPSF